MNRFFLDLMPGGFCIVFGWKREEDIVKDRLFQYAAGGIAKLAEVHIWMNLMKIEEVRI